MDENKNFYILIRSDLDFSVGKLMLYLGHLCTTMAWQYLCHDDRPDLVQKFKDWFFSNQTKIILKVKDLEELIEFEQRARMVYNFYTFKIEDAIHKGDEGTLTMIGIEPIFQFDAGVLGLGKLEVYK